ncbi:cysteine hydrolase family protein [Butyricicoccus sp.]|uniref:cysteine hydrolase family protein n=1 Tax=Butyricicoccus sp. TaxID=2049021 RepID=UPI003736B0B2
MHVLVVVDMQKDFIDGALGTKEAQAIVPHVVEKIENFDGRVIATRDTHGENYLQTAEGQKLPVTHCIEGTDGWQLHPDIAALISRKPIDKPTFGSTELAKLLEKCHSDHTIDSITLVGLCTDICVISNALLLKAVLPEVPIFVDASCCAGVTPESHENALRAMEMCQITVVGR